MAKNRLSKKELELQLLELEGIDFLKCKFLQSVRWDMICDYDSEGSKEPEEVMEHILKMCPSYEDFEALYDNNDIIEGCKLWHLSEYNFNLYKCILGLIDSL